MIDTQPVIQDCGVGGFAATVPRLIERAGKQASNRFLEFFTAEIRNAGTREAYARAVGQFVRWCDAAGLSLLEIEPLVVATYIESLTRRLGPSAVKLHLAAIRRLFDYLVVGQIIPTNPAASVRGPKYVVKKGKTPVLSADEARQLLDAIDTTFDLRIARSCLNRRDGLQLRPSLGGRWNECRRLLRAGTANVVSLP